MSTLGLLRNVFFAPLAKPKSAEHVSEMHSGHASSVVSLHDHHNIEIKTISELCGSKSMVETDMYLFVPKNFELPGVGKDELISDFRSRVRLALPVSGEQGAAALDQAIVNLNAQIQALKTAEHSGETLVDINHALCEPLLEAAKDLSAVIAETLKHRSHEHSRRFMISHSLMTIPQSAIAGLEELGSNVADTARMMVKVRDLFQVKAEAPAAILVFLDEYLSHLYVQYLGSIRNELVGFPTPKSTENDLVYSKARAKVEELLDFLQGQEARHRLKFGIRAADEESDLDRETRLVRLSQLKKFFQSTTFIDISRQQSAKKISESTATIGTAVAAIIAATIEQFGRGAASDVAWQGLGILSLGVIVYVLRDRMKDWAKSKFHQKALKFLPDFEQKLMAKNAKIGRVKEWFEIMKNKNVPLDVLSLRRAAALTEMEKRLPEDVFHCRKIQELDAASLAESNRLSHSRALFENTRVNFERYLKHMDDAFKDLTDLDPSGRFLSSRSHRVYYFYLCVKTISGPAESFSSKLRNDPAPRAARQTQTLLYRVVLDKNGVVRLENLEIEAKKKLNRESDRS